jgi:outer membrane protein TolC
MLLALLVSASTTFAQSLPAKPFKSALQDVLRAPEYQSTLSEIRSIEMDYASRELVLQPVLEAEAKRANENRQLLNPGTLTTRPRIDSYGLTVIKPFGTGTELEVGPSYEKALTPGLAGGNRDTVDWHISLTQSLWKDAFGRSTRLRRAREDYQRKQELADALLRQGQLLYDFESLYWDWALARRVFDLQEKNVKRGRQILKWVQDRFNRAAAESTDLLQARALLTQRELQVATQQLSITQTGARIERFVPNHGWRPDPKDLEIARNPEELLSGWKADSLNKIESLSYLSAENEALAEEEKAKETRETIRPELDLELTYGKNAIDTEGSTALRRSYQEDHDYSSIGVVFRTGLDLGDERRKVESARAARDAAKQRREARLAENKVAWNQLKQELSDLQSRVDRATELVDLQIKKANAERERYRKGRSTAFQAITFELEAAEAEITLWTLYALMRKTEARARLFAR